MVRALATGDIKLRHWGKMLGKEVLVAGLLGLTMALAVYALGYWRGGLDIALVVAATMMIVVLVGSFSWLVFTLFYSAVLAWTRQPPADL